jgi:hypothetical protein
MIFISTDIIVGSNNLGDFYEFDTFESAFLWVSQNLHIEAFSISLSKFGISLVSNLYSNHSAFISFLDQSDLSPFYEKLLTFK